MNYLPKNEIAVDTYEQACTIAKILLDNRNAVMITMEEQLYIVNWEFSWLSDRNDVIFRSREDWEYEETIERKELEREEEEWEREQEERRKHQQIYGQTSLFDEEECE